MGEGEVGELSKLKSQKTYFPALYLRVGGTPPTSLSLGSPPLVSSASLVKANCLINVGAMLSAETLNTYVPSNKYIIMHNIFILSVCTLAKDFGVVLCPKANRNRADTCVHIAS